MTICFNIFLLVALCCISTCTTRGILRGCPDGSEPVNCKANPCRVTTCTYFPEATCEADYCGGCNARFFVDKGRQEVTASCATGCPDGSWPVNCLLDPCDPRIAPTCEAFPDAVCHSDYCGGCNARFFVDKGRQEVTASCATGCPDGSWPVNCLLDPCDPRIAPTCEAFPDAVCHSDYCGGCNARFFVGSREVTDMCDLSNGQCPYKGQVFFKCLPCQLSCDGTVTCNVMCQPGCGCPPDEAFDEGEKRCVPPALCPMPELLAAESFSLCPIAGQVIQECRTCPATCENPGLACPEICRKGCGCPYRQLIDEAAKRCVNPKQCPKHAELHY